VVILATTRIGVKLALQVIEFLALAGSAIFLTAVVLAAAYGRHDRRTKERRTLTLQRAKDFRRLLSDSLGQPIGFTTVWSSEADQRIYLLLKYWLSGTLDSGISSGATLEVHFQEEAAPGEQVNQKRVVLRTDFRPDNGNNAYTTSVATLVSQWVEIVKEHGRLTYEMALNLSVENELLHDWLPTPIV